MTMKVRSGDSGSPIFAYDNNEPVFVGLVTSYVQVEGYYFSVGTRIDAVLRVLSGR